MSIVDKDEQEERICIIHVLFESIRKYISKNRSETKACLTNTLGKRWYRSLVIAGISQNSDDCSLQTDLGGPKIPRSGFPIRFTTKVQVETRSGYFFD